MRVKKEYFIPKLCWEGFLVCKTTWKIFLKGGCPSCCWGPHLMSPRAQTAGLSWRWSYRGNHCGRDPPPPPARGSPGRLWQGRSPHQSQTCCYSSLPLLSLQGLQQEKCGFPALLGPPLSWWGSEAHHLPNWAPRWGQNPEGRPSRSPPSEVQSPSAHPWRAEGSWTDGGLW